MSNVWTFDIEEQDITKDAGVVVTQGTGELQVSGKLKTALVGETTTIVVSTTSVIPFSSTSANLVVGDVTVVANNINSATPTGKKHAEYNEEPYNGPERKGMEITGARALFCGNGGGGGGWGNFDDKKLIINTTDVTISKWNVSSSKWLLSNSSSCDKRYGSITTGNPFRDLRLSSYSYFFHERAFRKQTWSLLSKWDAMSRKNLLLEDDTVRYRCCTDHVVAGKRVKSGRKINSPLRTSLQQNRDRNNNLEACLYRIGN